jgi:hypothetical protein
MGLAPGYVWRVTAFRPQRSRNVGCRREAPHPRQEEHVGDLQTPAVRLPRLPNKANAALDRIEIPQDVVDRISELLTPASSVIISDYGISLETGKNTDFIVVTH